MQIIGSGFGRTGTMSLKRAIEQLGLGPCYHMEDVIREPYRFQDWFALAEGQPADWDHIFDGYNATVDFPACTYYKELLAAYPDAKVIHTVRDPERWYDSFYNTIYYGRDMFPTWAKKILPPARNYTGMMDHVWNDVLQGQMENKAGMVAIFEAHTAEVLATVPPEQLLVYEVKDGWGPLCDFLGVPIPATPFPNVNDKEVFRHRIDNVRRSMRLLPFIGLGIVAVILLLIFR